MGFLKSLGMAMSMVAYDTYKESKADEQKRNKIKQEEIEELSRLASAIMEDTVDIAHRLTPNSVPDVLVKGLRLLPVYAFFNALKSQTVPVSHEQTEYIRIYFDNINFGYSSSDFTQSLNTNNSLRKEMQSLVGLSRDFIGDYWKSLFVIIRKTAIPIGDVNIVDHYFAMVASFLALSGRFDWSNSDHNSAFIDAFYYQFGNITIDNDNDETENLFDVHSEKTPIQHYIKMREITREIAESSEDNEIVENLFTFFAVGFLEAFLEKLPIEFQDKRKLLAAFLEELSIDIGYSIDDILQSIGSGSELEKFTYNLASGFSNDINNYWILQAIAAQKGDCISLCLNFFKESSALVIGLANSYAELYPQINLYNVALSVVSDFSEYLSQLYANGQ